MKMVAFACRRLFGGTLLVAALALPGLALGAGLNASDPDVGYQIDAKASAALTPADAAKLDKALKTAAADYRAGRFASALQSYEAAQQLDPGRADIQTMLASARRLDGAQREAAAKLPADIKDRDLFFQSAYQAALQNEQDHKSLQAYNGFYQLWLTAGDYNGKTVKMISRVASELKDQAPASPAQAPSFQVASLASDAKDPSPAMPASINPPSAPATAPAAAVDPVQAAAASLVGDLTAPSATAGASGVQGDLVRAQAAIQTGHYDDAKRMLDSILFREPLNEQAHQQLAWLDRLQQGEASMQATGSRIDIKPLAAIPNIKAPIMLAQADTATSASTTPPVLDEVARLQVNHTLYQVQQDIQAGKLDDAQTKLKSALAIWPTNEQALQLQAQIDAKTTGGAVPMAASSPSASEPKPMSAPTGLAGPYQLSPDMLKTIDAMHKEASRNYQEGNLAKAREVWSQILEKDPGNKLAQTWLDNTDAAFKQGLDNKVAEAAAMKKKEAGRQLLDAPISISTEREVTLTEFMNSLSFATSVELQYYIADGARATIFGAFKDMPLRKVLDAVLEPAGLTWTINEDNLITITQKLKTKTFPLTPEQMSQVRSLMDSGDFYKSIWGQTEPPAKGISMTLDERQNLLIVTGSALHIQRVESLIPALSNTATNDLVTQFYKIRESDGERIRALINSVIHSKNDSVFDAERKIYIDGEDLIVRDTAENIKQIEDLLLDKGFIQRLRNESIDIQSFSLVPKNIETIKSDVVQNFTSHVVEAIRVFLYAQEGESNAAAEGRRWWFDEDSLQLTIVDTPSNLQRVSEYINALPQINNKSQQKVVRLTAALATDLAASIERILQLTSSSGNGLGLGSNTGNTQSVSLNRGDSKQVFDTQIRLIRVTQGNVNDIHSDSAQIQINTGTQVQTASLQEQQTQSAGDYIITADDIQPSGGQNGNGDGHIQMTVQYAPQALLAAQQAAQQTAIQQQAQQAFGGAGGLGGVAGAPGAAQQAAPDQGITITPVTELNALVLRYTKPELFQEAMDLIKQLDQPIRQVSIETKFVQVNENKAKEVGAELSISGLGSGAPVDWGNQLINTSFANDASEFRSALDSTLTNPFGPTFNKGTTVVSAVIGAFPSVQYSLRLLEAEGVVSVVNGPQVTATDGTPATFRIETYQTGAGTAPAANGFVTATVPAAPSAPFLGTGTGQIGGGGGAGGTAGLANGVVLTVTPQVTSENSILLNQLTAELTDFDQFVNMLLTPAANAIAGVTDQSIFNPIVSPQTFTSNPLALLYKRKYIQTNARISNGGTIVIGGWTGERSEEHTSGIPVLRNMPYLGKLLFSRASYTRDRTQLLIFLTGYLVK